MSELFVVQKNCISKMLEIYPAQKRHVISGLRKPFLCLHLHCQFKTEIVLFSQNFVFSRKHSISLNHNQITDLSISWCLQFHGDALITNSALQLFRDRTALHDSGIQNKGLQWFSWILYFVFSEWLLTLEIYQLECSQASNVKNNYGKKN